MTLFILAPREQLVPRLVWIYPPYDALALSRMRIHAP